MLSDKLKNLRKDKNLLQKEVAAAINISDKRLSNYENGTRKPDIDTIIKLAEFYGVSSDYLLGIKSKDDIVVKRLHKLKSEFVDSMDELIKQME